MRLEELLINLDGLSDEEAEDLGRHEYRDLYLNRGKIGVLELYKGGEVVFHENRYEHAFRTSQDHRGNPYSKTVVARDRIEKMRWIRAIIAGEVPKTECWLVPARPGKSGRDRIYVVWENRYVVWFSARDKGGWMFSTAYSATGQDIRRYTSRGSQLWIVPERKEAP